MRTSRWATAPVVALAATTLSVACGDSESTPRRGAAPSRPTGGDEVVVQVMVAGGFVPVEAALSAVPSLTVLGDGTVITQAAVPAIYPGPAITPLQAATADARTVDQLVRRAGELGLLGGPLEFGRPPVADAPDTTVTVVAGGRAHTHTAYALDITEDPRRRERTTLSEQEGTNRAALKLFLAATQQLPPGDRQWQPQAIAVYALGDHRPEPELPQRPVAWPLAKPPSTTGGNHPCTLFRGEEARVLLDVLAQANSLTPWVVQGTPRSLAFRPIVPGQPGCPDQ